MTMSSTEKQHLSVRTYRKGDEDDMVHVFRETADLNLRNRGEAALYPASFIWCRPYYLLSPESCFVVDDGNGRVVGYIIGTPDTSTFVEEWRQRYLPYLSEHGIAKPTPEEDISWTTNMPNALHFLANSPEQLLHESFPGLLGRYPGHLHIDILPDYQRFGMGRRLMEMFLARMREEGARGVHLGMNAANEGAERFYVRMGFSRFDEVMDRGASGEAGRDGTTIYMVISL